MNLVETSPLVGDSGAYRVVKPLGLAGATARVYLVQRQQDKRLFALKLMQPGLSPEMRKRFQDEMANLQRLRRSEDHLDANHIPAIIESSNLLQPATQELLRLLETPFIIMDFAEGTDIMTLLTDKNCLPEADALEVIRQFAEVLYAVHSENLTYTDMKLSNLIWNEKTRYLRVIDWNVIAENRLEQDAPKDRLRAAAYLYQLVTGLPVELDAAGVGTVNQKYRLLEKFKNLSEGTRAFLVKAFHPDISSRHGNGGPQVDCTREFLKELSTLARRFMLSTSELIEKGCDAMKDRQWQEALVYLDLANRQFDIENDPDQSIQLGKDLEKVRSDAHKIVRQAFLSGYGRYINGLLAEALEDFEKAMRDDPYDEEARLFAILTHFAIEIGADSYPGFKEPMEECIRALLKEHLDLADNALARLPSLASGLTAARSLKAEIKIRQAVTQGLSQLKEDKIEEARESFRSAYQVRDQILYIDLLEENLESLSDLYHRMEELARLKREAEACLAEERFRDAASLFYQARNISRGSVHSNKRYQYAASLDAIRRALDAGDPENAMEKYQQAAGRFGDEPGLIKLKAMVSEVRGEQLRSRAEVAYQAGDYEKAREDFSETLKYKPEDQAAKTRLKEIKQQIAARYQEQLAQFESKLRENASVEECDKTIRLVEESGLQAFEEVQQFITRIQGLKESIISLSNRLQDSISYGDLSRQLEILNEAAAKKWQLKQGEPGLLKNELIPRITQRDIDQASSHLTHCFPGEALVICDRLLQSDLPGEKKSGLEVLREKAYKLDNLLKEWTQAGEKLEQLPGDSEDAELERLKTRENSLLILSRMKQIEPALQSPEEIQKYAEKQTELLKDVETFIEKSHLQGRNCLQYDDFNTGRKVYFRLSEALSIYQKVADNAPVNIEKWRQWNREFDSLLILLTAKPAGKYFDWPSILSELADQVQDPQVKEVISGLETEMKDEGNRQPVDELKAYVNDSPIACWLHGELDKELEKRTSIKEHSDKLEALLEKLPDTTQDHTARLRLEDEIWQEIEELKSLDQERAGSFGGRLTNTLDSLLGISKIDPGSQEKRKRLLELQRRICRRCRTENNDNGDQYIKEFEQDRHFKDIISSYKTNHTNLLIKLKHRKNGSIQEGLKELFALREEFGEFPELQQAIEETLDELSRRENKDEFDKLCRTFDKASIPDDWQKLEQNRAKIDSSLLSGEEKRRFQEMTEIIDYHLIVKKTIEKKDFEEYLRDGKNERVEKWLSALEWHAKEGKIVDILPLTAKNLDDSEKDWLSKGLIDLKSLQSIRWIKYLVRGFTDLKQQANPGPGKSGSKRRTT